MKGLLDTHTFIWWDSEPSKLSAGALTFFQDPANTALLSVVSVWEIVIKQQLGKLTLNTPLAALLARQRANGIQVLSVTLDHVLALEGLPPAQRPFRPPVDRSGECRGGSAHHRGCRGCPVSRPGGVVTAQGQRG